MVSQHGNLNENQRRSFVIAREFVILQLYVWAAIFVALFELLVLQNSWNRKPEEALLVGYITFLLTYVPIQYIRMVYSAWQIWKRKVPPPEVTAEAEKESAQSASDALSKLLANN